MAERISPLIDAADLMLLRGNSNVVLVDANGATDARNTYENHHLKGAVFVDMNRQLAEIGPNASQGGRHPLPSASKFATSLTELGITPDSHVVAYDDKNGANAAARFWWMLKAIGHKRVQVLDGGYQSAVAAGYPVTSERTEAKKVDPYPAREFKLPLAGMTDVDHARKDHDFMVVDVRDPDRFNGIKEPIDLIAGHIPGAVNIPFASNLGPDGRFLSPDELKSKYEQAFGEIAASHVIVHCGSGVTACHTLLALDYAGMEIPNLYVGSWSEWSRNDNPMEPERK
jgi:thiosulfate/3-mercaptopyruvate sulfurtransferase